MSCVQMIAASWMWPRHTDFTAQKIMASCFLFKKRNHTYHIPKFFHKPTIHTEVAPSRTTNYHSHRGCVCWHWCSTPTTHTIGTIWNNGWDRLAETQHDRHTDGHPLSISLACKPFILEVIPRMNRYHWWIWWLGGRRRWILKHDQEK